MLNAPKHTRPRSRPVRGIVALELVVVLPVLVAFVLAVVEFGVILAQVKHVAFASREGARLAARQQPGDLPTAVSAINLRVNEVLQAGGISDGSCKVILEHNVTSISTGQSQNIQPTTNPCPNCMVSTNVPGLPTDGVRVTVCVQMENLGPNLLSSFGFTLVGKTVSQTTTLPYHTP